MPILIWQKSTYQLAKHEDQRLKLWTASCSSARRGALTFRYDWLDKAGVSQPTNADEFYAAMVCLYQIWKRESLGPGLH